MTNPHVETVEEFFGALDRGELRDDLIHPEMLMTNTEGFLIADDYHGPDGFRRWMRNMTEDLEATRYAIDRVEETADRDVLLSRCRINGHARTAAMDVELVWWAACGFRDGKIARLAGAKSHRHALELAAQISAEGGAA